MLKIELENKVAALELELKNFKTLARGVAEEALRENCSDALPYVTDLNKALDLNMTRAGVMAIDIEIPLQLEADYSEGLSERDLKLTYKGEEIEINSLDDLETN